MTPDGVSIVAQAQRHKGYPFWLDKESIRSSNLSIRSCGGRSLTTRASRDSASYLTMRFDPMPVGERNDSTNDVESQDTGQRHLWIEGGDRVGHVLSRECSRE
jgi:hypothetical protein